jgi:predicted polyphosphate/ATP-dependent NAD kinase
MVFKIGFLINPIAGMGGKVGLKGTDGVIDQAKNLGAKPISPDKALETLEEYISKYSQNDDIQWFTCSKIMGYNELLKAGAKKIQVVYTYKNGKTCSDDTKKICEIFLNKNVGLILFCGGDGTARDIFSIIGDNIPILGIPSGVKMHSAVFGINTIATAKILHEFVNNRLTIGDVEIMDLDEDRYRKGEWNIKLFGVAKGIVEPTYVQVGKSVFESVSDNAIKDELAEHIEDEIKENPDFLYLFGSGGTINYLADKLGLKNTLLGIDAYYNGKIIGSDLNEKNILRLIDKHPKTKVILSPIGAQGFILGRGNLQLSPEVIRKIGINNIIVVSTPSKLASISLIRVDSGDKNLDKMFYNHEFMMVVIGYRLSRVVKIQN